MRVTKGREQTCIKHGTSHARNMASTLTSLDQAIGSSSDEAHTRGTEGVSE